jgi:hypothetical protein
MCLYIHTYVCMCVCVYVDLRETVFEITGYVCLAQNMVDFMAVLNVAMNL